MPRNPRHVHRLYGEAPSVASVAAHPGSTAEAVGRSSASCTVAHDFEQERPSLVVIQGHHLAQADSITEAQSWSPRLGCKSVFSPALSNSTGNGTSGGVAVVIRSHIGVTPHRGPVEVARTQTIVVVSVDACVPHGFALIGLYYFLRGGVRRPECGTACSSGAAGGFFEGAMDHWQMTPEELQQTN